MIVWISKFNKQTHDNQDKQNTEMLVFAKDLVLVIHYPSSLT